MPTSEADGPRVEAEPVKAGEVLSQGAAEGLTPDSAREAREATEGEGAPTAEAAEESTGCVLRLLTAWCSVSSASMGLIAASSVCRVTRALPAGGTKSLGRSASSAGVLCMI